MTRDKLKLGITVLDFVLIYLTALWLIRGLTYGLTNIEITFNYSYLLINITALILNLVVIYRKKYF